MNNAAMKDAQRETDATCEPFRGTFPEWLRSMSDVEARQALEAAIDSMRIKDGRMPNFLARIGERYMPLRARSQAFDNPAGDFMVLAFDALHREYTQACAE